MALVARDVDEFAGHRPAERVVVGVEHVVRVLEQLRPLALQPHRVERDARAHRAAVALAHPAVVVGHLRVAPLLARRDLDVALDAALAARPATARGGGRGAAHCAPTTSEPWVSHEHSSNASRAAGRARTRLAHLRDLLVSEQLTTTRVLQRTAACAQQQQQKHMGAWRARCCSGHRPSHRVAPAAPPPGSFAPTQRDCAKLRARRGHFAAPFKHTTTFSTPPVPRRTRLAKSKNKSP